MKFLYCRVSTAEQCELRQTELAKELGIEERFVYLDKQSGKDTNRTELKKMLEFCRQGDTIYCESISRMARNTKDFLEIIEQLNQKQVEFISLKECIDTSTPQGRLMLTIIAAINAFERENLLERQREGIAIAKAEGKYKGRKPVEVEDFEPYYTDYMQRKYNKTQLAKKLKVSRPTLNRLFEEYEKTLDIAE